jgi:hypothetical protein
MLGMVGSSAWALPGVPPFMVINPVDSNGCIVYTTNQAGPFPKLNVQAPAATDEFPANICSEKDILPGKGNFNAPAVDDPSYLTFNTVALAAGNSIELLQKARVLVAIAPTITVGAGATLAEKIIDTPTFTGTGIPFPAIVSTGADINCKSDTISIPPGNYGALDVNNCTVNFVPGAVGDPLEYTFKYVISRNSDHVFTAKPDDQLLSVLVEQFVRYGHTDNVNAEKEPQVTIWVAGTDNGYGGLNKNKKGKTTNEPSAFQWGGDGAFNVCHVYAKNGTMGIAGHVDAMARFLGQNFQQNSGPFGTIIHPQEICSVQVQCACVKSVACEGDNLVLTGDLEYTEFNVGGLFNTTVGASVNSANPSSAAQGNGGTNNNGVLGPADLDLTTPTKIKVPVSSFGLSAGQYTPTFACPESKGNPSVPLGFTMLTGSILQTDGTSCEIIAP